VGLYKARDSFFAKHKDATGTVACAVRDRQNKGEEITAKDEHFITAPRFTTSSKKYEWLNQVQAVGRMVSSSNKKNQVRHICNPVTFTRRLISRAICGLPEGDQTEAEEGCGLVRALDDAYAVEVVHGPWGSAEEFDFDVCLSANLYQLFKLVGWDEQVFSLGDGLC
jgi:hypothetical protein